MARKSYQDRVARGAHRLTKKLPLSLAKLAPESTAQSAAPATSEALDEDTRLYS
jgi:hypothetical protein